MDDLLFSFFEQASAAVAPRVEPPRPPRQPERWNEAKKTPDLSATERDAS